MGYSHVPVLVLSVAEDLLYERCRSVRGLSEQVCGRGGRNCERVVRGLSEQVGGRGGRNCERVVGGGEGVSEKVGELKSE